MPDAIDEWVITQHAAIEMQRRGIGGETVAAVLKSPEQRLRVRAGRDVLQSRIKLDGQTYIVRVFVDVDRKPPEVVTAYRSSKIGKYWGSSS